MSGGRPEAAACVNTEGVRRRPCPEDNSTSGARPETAACVTTEVAV